jgi:hypothetical protein
MSLFSSEGSGFLDGLVKRVVPSKNSGTKGQALLHAPPFSN